MDEQNRNLILAMVLSALVLIGWYTIFPPPEPPISDTTVETSSEGSALPGEGSGEANIQTSSSQRPEAARIPILSDRLQGSLSLEGGRIDELELRDYRISISPDAPTVSLLAPETSRTQQPYYAVHGWAPAPGGPALNLPGPQTIWSLESGETLTPNAPITLVWENGEGLTFRREISLDENYLFSIRQSVENNTATQLSLRPYGLIVRVGEPQDLTNIFILHEGLVAMEDGELTEMGYSNFPDMKPDTARSIPTESFKIQENGWIGFTDHYWMTTLLPEPGQAFSARARYLPRSEIYQVETVLPVLDVPAGQTGEAKTALFAGAKEWETIRNYEVGREVSGPIASLQLGLGLAPREGYQDFLNSIDWGWFFFLTKPIFWLLHELNLLIGNMGWAIIALTILLKAVLFPLAYKSYTSMARMRELQPEMEAIKERAGDDRQKLQQEIMALYREKKVNPAAGCLPLLLQIPIFFSLYKVIFVTIELRHAPWFGWIQDLSAPDPSSIFNLFGILPWAAPDLGALAIISLGILPLFLGISMWLQQKLNPAPTDPTQAAIFAWMPWVFMFMLGSFASGLVIYWIANNVITFIQQFMIMRSHGFTPDLFGNIRKSFSRKKAKE